MILTKGDIFLANDILWISDDYVNTEKERWTFACKNYKNNEWNLCNSDRVEQVYTKNEHPEYYL